MYVKKYYLNKREKIPRKITTCQLEGCGKELKRFGEKRQDKYCSPEHYILARKKYRKDWEGSHKENVKKWKKDYYEKNKKEINRKAKENVHKKNNTPKLQKVRESGAFPEE